MSQPGDSTVVNANLIDLALQLLAQLEMTGDDGQLEPLEVLHHRAVEAIRLDRP